MLNDKLIALGFICLSWIMRAFGAVQQQRGKLDKPLIWNNPLANLLLILIWVGLLIIGLMKGYSAGGVKVLIYLSIIYFILLPILFGNLVKKILDRIGF